MQDHPKLCLLSRAAGGDSWLESGQENTSLKCQRSWHRLMKLSSWFFGQLRSGHKEGICACGPVDPQGFETSYRVAQSQVRCLSQLLRNLLQHLGGVAPPLSERHLHLCHETAEILEFLECLFWCVGSREAIVNVKRFLDHGCSFRILVLVVICHLVEHSCGQERRRGNAKSQPLHPAIVESVGLDLWPGICACPSPFCPEQFPGTFCECLR